MLKMMPIITQKASVRFTELLTPREDTKMIIEAMPVTTVTKTGAMTLNTPEEANILDMEMITD